MDTLFASSVDFTRWLQTNYPELAGLMRAISTLGIFEFYLAIIPLIYWSIHKQAGKHIAYVISLASFVNAALKGFIREPRPYWLDSSIKLDDGTGYGWPSGHSQLGPTLYFMAAIWARRSWAWGLAVVLTLLMGLSRIYLGVHTWVDVLGGYFVALLHLVGYGIYVRYVRGRIRNRILGQRLLIVLLVPTILSTIYFLMRFVLATADLTVSWAAFIPAAELQALEDAATGIGMLVGLGVGFLLEASRTNFSVAGPIWQRVARYLLGIAILVGLWFGSGQVVPDDPLWLAVPLRILRYAILGLFMAYWAPALFVRIGLAPAGPGPEVSLAVNQDSLLKR